MENVKNLILSIVKNSIEAGAGRIEMLINHSEEKGSFAFRITDTGKGLKWDELSALLGDIPQDKQDKSIFKLRRLADDFNGTFEFESSPKSGAIFAVSFNYRAAGVDVSNSHRAVEEILTNYPHIDVNYLHIYNGKAFMFAKSNSAGTEESIQNITKGIALLYGEK